MKNPVFQKTFTPLDNNILQSDRVKDKYLAGFTLLEMLIYVAVLSMVILTVSSFLLWSINSNSKAKALREVTDNGERVILSITSEIRAASGIYLPTSVFGSNPGQLSLETTNYLPPSEDTTYIDFFLCGNRVCLKKESQNPIALTSDQVRVTKLIFSQISTTSVQISIEVDFNDQTGRPERQAVFQATSTASLRSY